MRLTPAAAIVVLLLANPAAPAPQPSSPAGGTTRPRILALTSAQGLSADERRAVFEEYVTAARAAASRSEWVRLQELAQHATQLFPELRRPWLHLSSAQLHQTRWGPAIESARRGAGARGDDGPPPASPEETAAGAAYWEGRALASTQRHDEALGRLRTARAEAPAWAEAARALGEAEFVAGHPKEAAAAYGAAFELDPQGGSALDLAYCAEARAASGDLQGGLAALQEALRRSPYEPGLHAKYGDLLRRDHQIAEAYYELVLEGLLQGFDGDFTAPAVGMAQSLVDAARSDTTTTAAHELRLVSSGLASLDAGQPHLAAHQFRHALGASRSAHPVPRFLYADALHRDAQDDPARAVLEEILGTNPEFVPALVLLADVATKLGQPRVATQSLDRARTLYPSYWKLQAKASP